MSVHPLPPRFGLSSESGPRLRLDREETNRSTFRLSEVWPDPRRHLRLQLDQSVPSLKDHRTSEVGSTGFPDQGVRMTQARTCVAPDSCPEEVPWPTV